MPFRCSLNCVLLFSSILLSWFPGSIMSAIVALHSIEIFNYHAWAAWLSTKPTVYFQCKGENRTYLPDVKKTLVSYTFKGKESWQPLTEFPDTKCKRCGFYEEGILKSDEFDEWELCPFDFTIPDGNYNKFKERELNATFVCPDCVPLGSDSNHTSGSRNGGKGMHLAIAHDGGKEMHLAMVILIIALVSTVFTLGLVASYMYWQKRKGVQGKPRLRKTF